MLYPTNLKIRNRSKIKIVEELLKYFKDEIKKQLRYLIYDIKHFTKTILVKLHI